MDLSFTPPFSGGIAMFKKEIRGPICALFLLSVGGLLLHIRFHKPTEELSHWIPAIVGLINVFVVPFLFNYARTVAWAYLLTIATVVIGTVTMAHHSWEHWDLPLTLQNVLLQSTLADIIILCAKLPLAHVILRHFRPKNR